MRVISAILLFVLLVVLIALACVNANVVTINYYFGSIKLALSLSLAISLILGCFIGLLFSFLVFIKQKRQQSKLKHQLQKMEKELRELRALAVKE